MNNSLSLESPQPQQQPQDVSSVSSACSFQSASKRSQFSHNTTSSSTTVSTSVSMSSSLTSPTTMTTTRTATPPSPPPSPSAASSFTRRRHRTKTNHPQQLNYHHEERGNQQPPSVSTVTAMSENSVCYSSSDGEDEQHYKALSSAYTSVGNEVGIREDFMGGSRRQSSQVNRLIMEQRSISPSHNLDDTFSISSMDVEMGGATGDVGLPRQTPAHPSEWRQLQPSASNRQRFYSAGSVPSPPLSSNFRTRRRRSSPSAQHQQHHSLAAAATTNPNTMDGNDRPNQSPSLRASLDAGMAAVRSWVRSRGNANNNRAQVQQQQRLQEPETIDEQSRPRSRSVTWQSGPSIASSSVASASSQCGNASVSEEELDDLLQLDDLSTFTNNSSRTMDDDNFINSNNPQHRPASAPTVPAPYRQHRRRHHRHQIHKPKPWSFQNNFQSHPDTILEELDESGDVVAGFVANNNDYLRSRQRSQSEPDGRRVTDFFLGPVPSTRYHHNSGTPSGGTPRRRRPLGSTLSRNQDGEEHQEATAPSSAAFSRRMKNLPLPLPRDSEGAPLSSSAAAALNDSPGNQVTAGSMPIREFSDAGASVATTATAAAESAIELTVVPSSYPSYPNDHAEQLGSNSISPLSPSTAAPAGNGEPPFQGTNGHITARTPPRNVAESSPARTSPRGGASSSSNNTGGSQQPQNPSMAREASARSDTTGHSQVTEAERQARIRWIRINRRFQFVITVVALLFSLLLFAILICWVVLTSAYILAFDKSCDVHLKRYYWLVTLQLVLDVFRSDIMRFVFRWDANSNQRIPVRVVVYNVTYLVYALLVLRLGVRSVFIEESTCQKTAPELYNSSMAFVSLSLAAWATIVCGYLLPFCVVAAMLTCNGYSPTSHISADERDGATPVIPAAYATTGAPPGTVDRLATIRLESVRESARECCICMEEFQTHDLLIETECKHVFHKQCCREWLRQARTCPVCRSDIPGSLQAAGQEEPDSSSRIPIGPTGRPVVGLFRILRRTTGAIARTMSTSSPSHAVPSNTNGSRISNG